MSSPSSSTYIPASAPRRVGIWARVSNAEKLFIFLFLLTLPLLNPWVRGDGVGYYAYARAPLIQRNLHFENDWRHADVAFRMNRFDAAGNILPGQYTRTGHLDNHFTAGPALLWLPFLALTHAGVLATNALGAHIPADGFSRPYRIAMAFGTALCGFLALWLSYRVARKYVPEFWAAASTLAIWFGTSLIVYMYFNPSWAHAQSAFVVALFLFYWDRTRNSRTLRQWFVLGLLGGLMTDVYYPNALAMLLPLVESAAAVLAVRQMAHVATSIGKLFADNSICGLGFVIALFPTFITREIVYGNPFALGSYTSSPWNWTSPAVVSVLFSADHGLFSWTPLIMLSVIGMFLVWRRDRILSAGMLLVFFAYLYLIGSFPTWDGISSFGSRFFVSLTPLFLIGLAVLCSRIAALVSLVGRAVPVTALALLVLWNLGMVFQWGTHLIPPRGPISWSKMAYNQVAVVPVRAGGILERYFVNRKDLMGRIEQQDVDQLKKDHQQE
jgi:hypothetical protein